MMNGPGDPGYPQWKLERRPAQRMLAPDEQPELFGRLTRIARNWGFEHCAYGMRAPLPVAEPEIVMLNDYTPAWQKHYQAHGYLRSTRSCSGG
jgi:LuxR family transcriptional regulator